MSGVQGVVDPVSPPNHPAPDKAGHNAVMSRVPVLLAFAIAVAFVAYLVTGRGGGIVVDGPVVAHDLGWGLGGTSGMEARVGGILEYDGECLLLTGNPVVWSDGTEWDEQEQAVRLDDGSLVHVGDQVFGAGGMAQEAPDRSPTWPTTPTGRELSGCLGEEGGLNVFNADAELEVEQEHC